MIKNIHTSARFRKDHKKLNMSGRYRMEKLYDIMKKIQIKNRDHALEGEWSHCRECHIEGDWILIYEIILKKEVIIFHRTGTHSELF